MKLAINIMGTTTARAEGLLPSRVGRSALRQIVVLLAVATIVASAGFTDNAKAFNPEQTTVKGAVNIEYWDLVPFWRNILTYWRYPYSNPGVGYYHYYANGQMVNYRTPCGSTRNSWWTQGFYCRGAIYLDLTHQRRNLRRYGDGSVGLWLAHEFAHHVQALVQLQRGRPNYELNADCLAGMYFRYGVTHTGKLNYGDYLEARRNIYRAGGDADHGTGRQRLNAFDYGYSAFSWPACNRQY